MRVKAHNTFLKDLIPSLPDTNTNWQDVRPVNENSTTAAGISHSRTAAKGWNNNIARERDDWNLDCCTVSAGPNSRKTRFIVHGFMSTGKRGWVVEMCLLLVEVEDVNCIAVDWADGAKGTYISAVNNIRVVGAEIAYFINTLMKMFQYRPSHIHIIGHSLGAHAAGDAGRRIRGIKRITGLDPAGPFFEGTPPKVRLDPTDARFVDVIHSNAARFPTVGFGMVNTTGHLDFYPNGGSIMPGCDDVIIPVTKKDCRVFAEDANSPICHHSRSHQFYFQSILHPNGFLGYPCKTYEFFRAYTAADNQGKTLNRLPKSILAETLELPVLQTRTVEVHLKRELSLFAVCKEPKQCQQSTFIWLLLCRLEPPNIYQAVRHEEKTGQDMNLNRLISGYTQAPLCLEVPR
ncbi:hypothetical protein KIL84_003469 [Mauremys mutica]|uniref:Triacylglycerol lipase n=1 Tax=Mauremys mutica TaxID=74926 RepID=A0A9D4ATI3_9SAUR|nr:hypothetical protein KIL84_003469 [Mauremys mutica]